VKTAMAILGSDKIPVTDLTMKSLNPAPHFPINIFPRDVLFPHKLNEAVHVPITVGHMLCDNRTMEIDKDFGFRTDHPVSLLTCEKLATVKTPI
jgi:hypothetical protein